MNWPVFRDLFFGRGVGTESLVCQPILVRTNDWDQVLTVSREWVLRPNEFV